MRLTLVTLCLLLLAACGGGGEDNQTGGSFGLVDAFYMSSGLGSHNPSDFAAMAGPLQVLDATNMEFDFLHRVFAPPAVGIFPATYVLGADRSIQVRSEEARPEGDGGFDARGDFGVFAHADPFEGPQMYVLLRQRLLQDAAPTTGTYHFVSLGRSLLGGVAVTARATLFPGIMALTDGRVNTAGTISTLVPQDVTTQINVQGDFEVDPQGSNLVGGLSEDGNVLMVGGGDLPGGQPQTQLLVRTSTSASDEDFAGAYWIVGMGGGNPWISATGVAVLDGAGGGEVTWRFTDGTTTETDTFAVRYDVGSDGGLSLELGFQTPALGLRGGVSQDGRFAAAAGAREADSDPLMVVLVRQN